MNLADRLDRIRQRNPRKIHPPSPMPAILSILTTSRGWLIRQTLKTLSYITAPLAAWLAAQGVEAAQTEAIIAGITAAALAGIEMLLSFLARKNR
jgi:hypothetical protein